MSKSKCVDLAALHRHRSNFQQRSRQSLLIFVRLLPALPGPSEALLSEAADAACRQGSRAPAWQRRMASWLPCAATCAFRPAEHITANCSHLATLLPLQAKWDAFDPATADGFAGWLPGFYDAVEAAADTESRWLQGVLPAQVATGFTYTTLAAWSQMLAMCGTGASMQDCGAPSVF